MPRQWRVLSAACLALAVLCAACTGSGNHGSAQAPTGRADATITVGSFDFPESILLAHIYAGALAAKGFPVRVMPDLGTRELVDPALMTGLIQLVPEYTGSALDFLSLGRLAAGPSPTCSRWHRAWCSGARPNAGNGLIACSA